MSVSSTNNIASLTSTTGSATNPNGALGKDAFLKLLLVQLQHQDPTQPTDTDKILSQTSQLATLEASNNTQAALEKLAASLGSTQQFSTISAIGKTADLGSDSIALDKGLSSTFEVYFPNAVSQGSVNITDSSGTIVKTLDVGTNPSGVYSFTWDGTDSTGNSVDGGVYHVNASYTDANNAAQTTRLGAYPIDAVRFENGSALVKLGSNYVPLSSIKEVY